MNSSQHSPFFTIITVVYNGEKFIEPTIKSVISQDFNAFEYIIWDGRSKDNTLSIINSYKQHIATLISEADLGVYDAMNKAVKHAKGQWILFLNAGDTFFDSSTLTKVYNHYCNSDLELSLIYGDVLVKNDTRNIVKSQSFKKIIYGMPFCHQSVFVRNKVFEEHQFDTSYSVCADYDFFLNLYSKKSSGYLRVNFPVSIFAAGGISYQKNVFEEYYRIARSYNGAFHWVSIYHLFKFRYKTIRSALKRVFLKMISFENS